MSLLRFSSASLALGLLLAAAPVDAKDFGFNSPGGREIYEQEESFGRATDTRRRALVVEVAVGAGPEGNLGALLGVINLPVRGLEWYAGVGFEFNPARHYTGAVRYMFNIDGYRPYVGAGYIFSELYELGTYTHNVFAEVGYSWVIHDTYHLTFGVGIRRIVYLGIRDDSPLRDPDVDQDFLAEETDRVPRWIPIAALRFSRAF